MTNSPTITLQQAQDKFGLLLSQRLAAGTADLPRDISERLRAARVQAVARRKLENVRTAGSVVASGTSASLTFGDEHMGMWGRIGSVIPLIALVAGLFLIHTVQNDRRASEVAEVDAALLTDDLPPSAYADPGFVQFLKSGGE
ncbi:DUF3619 family protein [Caenimonas aquaedulcis]|uniref:DUF3619 family protein n=1 Tax=Caenimonas aquaedulcis TaxID=2793270 RepID=A0A931MF90_9BURK|nr:DUF3619 family protein [Caenimonas aquaedulcis]MBG9387136.1 DUF3619 family protein [Caenimonas aquaedulcis]